MRLIFVNLPVNNVKASTAFFHGLGFTLNPQFSDESCTCMVVDANIFVMLLDHERFKEFINGEINDGTSTEVITCLSAESRQQVDDILSRALASGGKPCRPIIEIGPMYGASFQDLDGHVWELMHMGSPSESQADCHAERESERTAS